MKEFFANEIISWARERWGEKRAPKYKLVPYKDYEVMQCEYCEIKAWAHQFGSCKGYEGWQHHLKAFLNIL